MFCLKQLIISKKRVGTKRFKKDNFIVDEAVDINKITSVLKS